MKWISLKERLPPKSTVKVASLIIGFNDLNGDIGIYKYGMPTDLTDYKRMYELTHWMPLPEPP